MRALRRVLALLLSVALALPLAGCRKESSDLPGPDTMATAFFDLSAHDDAAPMCAALGSEVSESGVRAAFLPPDYYSSMASELTAQFSEMGISVSDEDAKLLADAALSMMDKITCTAQVKELDEAAGTATVTVEVTTFPSSAFFSAATTAVADMDLSEFLSDDLDAVYSKIIHAVADTLTSLQPSGDTQSIDVPFSLQEVTIDGRQTKLWAPNNADDFLEQITSLVTGGLS